MRQALRLPLELEPLAAQKAMASMVLRRWKVAVETVYVIDVDRIAFVDRRGEARTALLALNVDGQPRVTSVVPGWPVA